MDGFPLTSSKVVAGAVALTLALATLTGCCCHRRPPTGDPGAVPTETRPLDVIEVEDPIETALLEQELGLTPVTTVGRKVYFRGDEALLGKLAELGYAVGQEDANEVLQRVMRVRGLEDEAMLDELGLRLLLREERSWVVYGPLARLRTLARLGFTVEDLRRGEEPRPREIVVVLDDPERVGEVARAGVDVYIAGYQPAGQEPTTDQRRRFVVRGGAFDYAIDALREKGFTVEIEPTPEEGSR